MASEIIFKNPPINELVCGIQFNPVNIPFYHIVNKYFSKVNNKFPNIEETIPLQQTFDILSRDKKGEVALEEPFVRYFFKDSNDVKLIQLQNGKYLFNWRKPEGESSEYPRFKSIFSEFLENWNTLKEIFSESDLTIEINQLELTYIDLFVYDDIGVPVNQFHKIFTFLNESSSILSQTDAMTIKLFKPINDLNGHYVLDLKPAKLNISSKDIIVVDSTLRGMLTESNETIENWFLRAHDEILNNFLEVINESIKAKWGFEK